MKMVAQRTGLSPHVLRVWERRYDAVTPDRSNSNQRLYTEKETVRLELLAQLTRAGHGIRQIAGLPEEELQSMVRSLPGEATTSGNAGPADAFLEDAWLCVLALDPAGLRDVLDKAAVSEGGSPLLERLLVPLIHRIGTGWESGELSIAEEHAASAVIREVLFLNSRPFAESAGAPGLVVATPAGQLHELGAVLVSALARRLGWRVTYLGPSLPAEEIARAVARAKPSAVALSVVYPGDDPLLPDELRRLRRLLPPGLPVIIGGRASASYGEVIAETGALTPVDLDGFKSELTGIRERRAKSAGFQAGAVSVG